MIVVLHAYSAANAGDGLLVDATLRLLQDAGAHLSDVHVVALAPATFAGLPDTVTVTAAPAGASTRPAVVAGRELAAQTAALTGVRAATTDLADLTRAADLIVGVGGGYLRSGTLLEAGKTAAAHLPQLLAAGTSNAASVYLPQSIGPLHGPVGAAVRAALRRIDLVHVRDDRSLDALGRHVNAARMPDLAVLELADTLPTLAQHPAAGDGPTVIVARDLNGGARYEQRLRALATALPNAIWAVQSTGRGNDDQAFYARMGLGTSHAPLRDVLTAHRPGVVISVRLHGALQSVLAGWPAIHLSYERKGFGAYDDLGVTDLVHNAWTFDPAVVAAQARTLQADPARFWTRVTQRSGALQAHRAQLVRALACRLPAAARATVPQTGADRLC